jgi:hydrogenase maturation protease
LSRKRIAIVGVGNILLGDEGIGVRVLEELEKEKYSEEINFLDAGTAFFSIVSELRNFEKAIIIDAVHGGRKAGTVYRFNIDDIVGKGNSIISLHDFGVMESIQLERVIAKLPDEIIFYGVEPQNVTPSLELSSVLQGKLKYVVKKIFEELNISGIRIIK